MSDLESRVAPCPVQALRLAPGTQWAGAADPAGVDIVGSFRLTSLPPLELRTTVLPDDLAAGQPGVWAPSPTKAGHKFRHYLVNLWTGEIASPEW